MTDWAGMGRLPASDFVGDSSSGSGLLGKLASAGIEVDLPYIYAVFHDDSQRFVYYLGELLSVREARGGIPSRVTTSTRSTIRPHRKND